MSPNPLGRWAESSEFAAIVRRCARRAGLPRDCDDDVAQEVRLRFLQQRVRAARDVTEPPAALLAAVTRRVAMELARARRRAEPLDAEGPAATDVSSGLSADVQQLFQDLTRFEELLTPHQVQAIRMCAEGLGPRKGAAALGISVAAFKERLLRAIRRLRGEAGRASRREEVRPALPRDVVRLHPEWEKALRLHEWGLSHRRIGHALGISREAARSLLRRLRRSGDP